MQRGRALGRFEADGHLKGDAPVLLGLARGDDTVPGIGERKLADIKPSERTTPTTSQPSPLASRVRFRPTKPLAPVTAMRWPTALVYAPVRSRPEFAQIASQ